jgi:superfamily II DNA or RNA helicase
MPALKEPVLIVQVGFGTLLYGGTVKKAVVDELKQKLTISNPRYEDALRMGYSVRNIPRYLNFLSEKDGVWIMPKGFTGRLIQLLLKHRCTFIVDADDTRVQKNIDFEFDSILNTAQADAAEKILKKHFVVAQLPTGAGKTLLALFCIFERKQPALVIVHTKELLYQWREAARQFLKLDGDDIGLLGDGHKKIGKKLTIAIINTLQRMVPQVREKIGFLIVDECHRVPSDTFSVTVKQFDCRYMLGITATPERTDRLTDLIHLYLGDLVYSMDSRDAQDEGLVLQPHVQIKQTHFDYPYNDDYPQMITALIHDQERNNMIVTNIGHMLSNDVSPLLVVSDRKEHCNELVRLLQERFNNNVKVGLLTGAVPSSRRKAIVKELNSGNLSVLVATTSLIQEGFDCKALSALFLTTPIKSATKLEQVVGRILRVDEGKECPTVFDYVDRNGVLQASYRNRFNVYRKMNAAFFN